MEKAKAQKLQRKLERELAKAFKQSLYTGCKKMIELAAKNVFKESSDNEQYLQAAQDRLLILYYYCAINEQPPSGTALVRILRESETDKEIMQALVYDYSDEFQRSVNEVLYACLNFYIELGDCIYPEEEVE